MANTLDLRGQTFGRLTVLEKMPTNKRTSKWRCICACGAAVIASGVVLKAGRKQSCGCLVKERMRAQGSHNHCRAGAETPTWRSWKSMHDRCRPTHKSHAYYYDKGIAVCKRWQKFKNFLVDMGERPVGTTLERTNNNKGYTPSNCVWATQSEQQSNKTTTRRYTFEGETKTLTAWSRDARCKVPYNTLHKRVRVYGFPFIESMTVKDWSCK